MGEGFTIEFVGDADLDRVEGVEHVELGERDLRGRVEADRVTEHDHVAPTGATTTAGVRSVLVTDVDEGIADLVSELGGERSGTDTGRIGLGDTDDTVDVPRADASAGAGAAGDRIRRGHERIGAVIKIEEGGLRTLEQHVLARFE